jgi:predicted DNA binding CopG/RHH family protein
MEIKLDAYEQDIENNAEKFVPLSDDKMAELNTIIDHANKTRNINIRMTEYDIGKVKERAASDGLPYQTLIASIIHRYITGRLVDERDIMKTMELVRA